MFRTIALAAREAHPVTAAPGPEPGGSVIKLGAGNEYNAQAIVDSFFEAASDFGRKKCTSVRSPCDPFASSVLCVDLSGR